MLSHHFVQLGAHRASASGDIMHLIYYATSYLVSIGGIVVVEIYF